MKRIDLSFQQICESNDPSSQHTVQVLHQKPSDGGNMEGGHNGLERTGLICLIHGRHCDPRSICSCQSNWEARVQLTVLVCRVHFLAGLFCQGQQTGRLRCRLGRSQISAGCFVVVFFNSEETIYNNHKYANSKLCSGGRVQTSAMHNFLMLNSGSPHQGRESRNLCKRNRETKVSDGCLIPMR